MSKYEEIKEVIETSTDAVEFAEFGDGVSDRWIDMAESRLGFKLPKYYKWWLKNYSGGEIYGYEIFSIYELDFDSVVGGDIVYMYELNQKNGIFGKSILPLCYTDDGSFGFDFSKPIQNDEPSVYHLEMDVKFAEDFFDFLKKFITGN